MFHIRLSTNYFSRVEDLTTHEDDNIDFIVGIWDQSATMTFLIIVPNIRISEQVLSTVLRNSIAVGKIIAIETYFNCPTEASWNRTYKDAFRNKMRGIKDQESYVIIVLSPP